MLGRERIDTILDKILASEIRGKRIRKKERKEQVLEKKHSLNKVTLLSSKNAGFTSDTHQVHPLCVVFKKSSSMFFPSVDEKGPKDEQYSRGVNTTEDLLRLGKCKEKFYISNDFDSDVQFKARVELVNSSRRMKLISNPPLKKLPKFTEAFFRTSLNEREAERARRNVVSKLALWNFGEYTNRILRNM